jgi:hypothetical protein
VGCVVLRKEVLVFMELKGEGYSYSRIAEKMERDRETVSRHIKGYTRYGEKWFTEERYRR